MPGFNAESVVEPLEFTLKPYAEASGVIPEPSTLQVQAYMNAVRLENERIRKEITGIPDDEPLEKTLKRMGPKQVEESIRRNSEIYSALCSGTPSAEDLAKLPHRVFAAFTAWLSKEMLDPEAVTGAGDAQVIPLQSAAAG
jgi:hypothetical protein